MRAAQHLDPGNCDDVYTYRTDATFDVTPKGGRSCGRARTRDPRLLPQGRSHRTSRRRVRAEAAHDGLLGRTIRLPDLAHLHAARSMLERHQLRPVPRDGPRPWLRDSGRRATGRIADRCFACDRRSAPAAVRWWAAPVWNGSSRLGGKWAEGRASAYSAALYADRSRGSSSEDRASSRSEHVSDQRAVVRRRRPRCATRCALRRASGPARHDGRLRASLRQLDRRRTRHPSNVGRSARYERCALGSCDDGRVTRVRLVAPPTGVIAGPQGLKHGAFKDPPR